MQRAFKTSELAPEERIAVERLIGRTLKDDEAFELIVHESRAPDQEEELSRRKRAAVRIRELAKGKTLGGITVRELIDEGRRL